METRLLFSSLATVSVLTVGAVTPPVVRAQSTAQQQQLEYERRQREYWREQERQREAERVRQQQMENWRRQDAEMRRDAKALMPRSDGLTTSPTAPGAPPGRSGATRPSGAADVCKRRPLAKGERNPLLGSWRYRDAPQGDNVNQLFGYLSAPGCALYAMGIAFREREVQTALSATPAQYGRADADWWVCIPGTEVEVIRFRIEGEGQLFDPDRNCRLVRTDASAATAVTAANTGAASTAAGVLSFAVTTEFSGRPQAVAGSSFFVLKSSADAALARSGVAATPGSTRLHAWSKACETQTPLCQQGMRGLMAAAAAVIKTDAGGMAKTPPLPPGTYYLFGVTRSTPTLVWDVKVDVVPGANNATLDPRNAVTLN